jgi:excinuclease ABC subunit A
LAESVATAMRLGDGILQVLDTESGELANYSRNLMCPDSGISYEEPSPNTFSFNSPYGMCPHCKGLGEIHEVDLKRVIPDNKKSINDVGIVPLGEVRQNFIFSQLRDRLCS